jgi:very-short-patch-repair endonuclease
MAKRKIITYNSNLKVSARRLRGNMTDAERMLWKYIRKKQIKGCQFLRQRPIGKYIVDFFCPEARLVLEVDGGQHYIEEGIEADRKRELFLNKQGLKILRFSNVDVLRNIEGVIEEINNYL